MHSFDEQIISLKKMAQMLIPYTFPLVDFREEHVILPLKQAMLKVDGYDLVLHYSIADYKRHYLETVQIQSTTLPFLPFSLVCKIGKRFLGTKSLSYVDLYKEDKKLYCWTLKRSKLGDILKPRKGETKITEYEGFSYNILNPKSINFL